MIKHNKTETELQIHRTNRWLPERKNLKEGRNSFVNLKAINL